jgi:hypothetical protein
MTARHLPLGSFQRDWRLVFFKKAGDDRQGIYIYIFFKRGIGLENDFEFDIYLKFVLGFIGF